MGVNGRDLGPEKGCYAPDQKPGPLTLAFSILKIDHCIFDSFLPARHIKGFPNGLDGAQQIAGRDNAGTGRDGGADGPDINVF